MPSTHSAGASLHCDSYSGSKALFSPGRLLSCRTRRKDVVSIDHAAIRARAAELAPDAISFRRDVHQHAELGHAEWRTTERVAETIVGQRHHPQDPA